MRSIMLQSRGINASRLVLRCMGLGGREPGPRSGAFADAARALYAACEIGVTMFDHADIYRQGRADVVLGGWLKQIPGLRDRVNIQSKCGIVPGRHDSSRTHIIKAVHGSLQRLGTSWLDLLLLHRPDPLLEPERVAQHLRSCRRPTRSGTSVYPT